MSYTFFASFSPIFGWLISRGLDRLILELFVLVLLSATDVVPFEMDTLSRLSILVVFFLSFILWLLLNHFCSAVFDGFWFALTSIILDSRILILDRLYINRSANVVSQTWWQMRKQSFEVCAFCHSIWLDCSVIICYHRLRLWRLLSRSSRALLKSLLQLSENTWQLLPVLRHLLVFDQGIIKATLFRADFVLALRCTFSGLGIAGRLWDINSFGSLLRHLKLVNKSK